jgi:hypothetical protein
MDSERGIVFAICTPPPRLAPIIDITFRTWQNRERIE